MKRIVILLLIIIGLYFIYDQFTRFDGFGSENNNTQAAGIEDVDLIKVNISSVSTTIITEDRKDVKVVYNGKEKLIVRELGDTIEVSIKHKGLGWFDWYPFSEKKKVNIYIPENYDRNMHISLGSGNLHFSGQSQSKPVKLEELTLDIGSGNMNLKNMIINQFEQNVASGNMNLKNMIINQFEQNVASGNVEINSLTTTTIGSFDLSSGTLNVKQYTGAIEANVSSGELNFQVAKLSDSIDIEVSSGDVGLDLPNNADFTLDGDANSGDITCDLPLTSKVQHKHSIKGKHGSGKYNIDLDVSSGDIHIH